MLQLCDSAGLDEAGQLGPEHERQTLSATVVPLLAQDTVLVCVPLPQTPEHVPQEPRAQTGHVTAVLHDLEPPGLVPAPSAAQTASPTVDPPFWHVTDRV